MEEQLPEPEQSSDQAGAGYFLKKDLSDKMPGSLAAIYSQLLHVDKGSFFQIQPHRTNTQRDTMKS